MNEHREMSPVSNPHSTEYQSKLTRDHGAKVFADKKSIAQSQHHLIAPQEAIHGHLHEVKYHDFINSITLLEPVNNVTLKVASHGCTRI